MIFRSEHGFCSGSARSTSLKNSQASSPSTHRFTLFNMYGNRPSLSAM